MFKLKIIGAALGTIAGCTVAAAGFLASWYVGGSGPLTFLGALGLGVGGGCAFLGGTVLWRYVREAEETRWREAVRRARASAEAAMDQLQARPVPSLPGDVDELYAAQEEAVRELARECATRCQALLDQQATMRSRMSGLTEHVDHIEKDRDRLRRIAERAARARAAFDEDPTHEEFGGIREPARRAPDLAFLRRPPPLSTIEEQIGSAVNGLDRGDRGRTLAQQAIEQSIQEEGAPHERRPAEA